jgi:hypothetical protein
MLCRHSLKAEHPSCKTHTLIEHINEEQGNNNAEHVPHVVGMCIPQASNLMLWALFALTHFKPFSVSCELLGINEDPVKTYAMFAFTPKGLEVLKNWEAVHECEDECDADRLHKHSQLMAESKALTASIAMGLEDDKIDFACPLNTSKRSEADFHIHQAVLELQQSGWFNSLDTQTLSHSAENEAFPNPDRIESLSKMWKRRSNNKSKGYLLLNIMPSIQNSRLTMDLPIRLNTTC